MKKVESAVRAPVVPQQAVPPGIKPPKIDTLEPAPPVKSVPAAPPSVNPK